jgi:hypothetical protein
LTNRKHTKIFLSIIILILLLMGPNLIMTGTGNPGGRGSANREYNCSGTSCHTTQGSSTIRMSVSNFNPLADQVITVTVTITGSEASSSPMGVFLIRSLTSSNSQPSVDGWEIISDPSGSSSYNYYESSDVTGGITWVWTLRAPSEPGTYRLYAREHNGNGNSFWNDYTAGLTISVGASDEVAKDLEPPNTMFYVILMVSILSVVLILYLLHLRSERIRAQDRKATRKRSKDYKGSASQKNMTKCTICGCSLKKENLERHLKKVHNR